MITLLILIALTLLAFGVAYTFYIYYWPAAPGWTWLSVFIGVGLTLIGEAGAILVTLSFSGLLTNYWYLALYGPVAFVLTGLPMIAGQIIKYRTQKRANHNAYQEL